MSKYILYTVYGSRQSQETVQLHSEVDRGKQVMVTYEQSMARKDQIINSLTRALAKQVKDHYWTHHTCTMHLVTINLVVHLFLFCVML